MRKYADCPGVVREFLSYHETIKSQSPRTIEEYHLDLRMFLRFMKLMRGGKSLNVPFEDVDILDIDLDFVGSITTSDVYEFLSWLANDRTIDPDAPQSQRGIEAAARARKLSALKSFYKYLTVRTKQLQENPVADLEYPKLRRSLPRYLTLEQSAALLDAVSGANEKRDYATYGSSECTLVEIIAPAGTPAIRLDLMPDVQNEPDEVILAPIEFLVTKVDRESNKIYMTCCKQPD